jgi:hypothetical protein
LEYNLIQGHQLNKQMIDLFYPHHLQIKIEFVDNILLINHLYQYDQNVEIINFLLHDQFHIQVQDNEMNLIYHYIAKYSQKKTQ